jgi:predicted cupin superfamily sugar epimerase
MIVNNKKHIEGHLYKETPTTKQVFITSEDYHNIPMVIYYLTIELNIGFTYSCSGR